MPSGRYAQGATAVPPVERAVFQRHELLYPSNLLTVLRLLLLPLTLRFARQPGRERAATAVVAVAMLTDLLDGPIARSRGEVSDLGRLLDPIADKLTLDTFAVALSQRGRFPWWASGLLLFRDAVILGGGAAVWLRRGWITPPNAAGKATTGALTLALLAYGMFGARLGRLALLLFLVPFGASIVTYLRALARYLADSDAGS
jgi:CDP-diacylglycerol---glycerol-3-phosphate 3-phosphatidyltransferase